MHSENLGIEREGNIQLPQDEDISTGLIGSLNIKPNSNPHMSRRTGLAHTWSETRDRSNWIATKSGGKATILWWEIQYSFICYSSQPLISHLGIHISCLLRLLGVVDVVDQVLDDSSGVGGLDALAVVGDDGAGGGTDNNGALLALFVRMSVVGSFHSEYWGPLRSEPVRHTFFP